jgi:hypothetical protein
MTSLPEDNLAAPPDERMRLADALDLSGVIQLSLIRALEKSAKANGYKIKEESHDGWYKFTGSIDTYLIAQAIELNVLEKQSHDRWYRRLLRWRR